MEPFGSITSTEGISTGIGAFVEVLLKMHGMGTIFTIGISATLLLMIAKWD